MSIIQDMRTNVCVWWKRSEQPSKGGRYTYERAEEVACWWTSKNEQFTSPTGKAVISQVIIYPDRIMAPGDVVRLGSLDALSGDEIVSQTPERIPGAKEIRLFGEHPDFDSQEVLYKAVV